MTFLGQKRAPHPAYTKAGRSATTVRAATSRRAVLPSGSALPVYSGSTFQPTFLLPHKPWCPLMWHWFALHNISGHQGSSKIPLVPAKSLYMISEHDSWAPRFAFIQSPVTFSSLFSNLSKICSVTEY